LTSIWTDLELKRLYYPSNYMIDSGTLLKISNYQSRANCFQTGLQYWKTSKIHHKK